MQITKIKWVRNPDGTQGYSWNPIRGKCPAACSLPDGRIYCYGHGLYNGRLKGIDPGEPEFNVEAWQKGRRKLKKSRKPLGIFLCSTFDLFHPVTNSIGDCGTAARDLIFSAIRYNHPRHRFYILTKFPQNIDRPIPPNVWLGVSITGDEDPPRTRFLGVRRPSSASLSMQLKLHYLKSIEAKLRFVSLEPMLNYPGSSIFEFLPYQNAPYATKETIDWLIVGRLTGHGHKYDPDSEDIQYLVSRANKHGVPIFLKNNLSGIWPDELIQEMPG